MRIDQFVHTLSFGDAISDEALTIQRLLRQMNIESDIFCVNAHDLVRKFTKSYQSYANDAGRTSSDQRLILHYSIASPLNELFIGACRARRTLIFHNLTPVRWFTRYNAQIAANLRSGFEELEKITRSADIVLADSQFNCSQLQTIGCSHAQVFPLPLDEKRWAEVQPDSGAAAILRGHGGKNILHVGRIAPNKRIEEIIKAFYFYHHKIERNSQLWLVGADVDNEIYYFELRNLVAQLRLKDAVHFQGVVSDRGLRTFYEECDLYLCLSEHEGFCVPLLEAMHFGLPVIAYDAGAVAETLGDGGILISRKDPAEVAELMDIVMTDAALGSSLRERGAGRAAAFSAARFKDSLERLVLGTVSESAPLRQAR